MISDRERQFGRALSFQVGGTEPPSEFFARGPTLLRFLRFEGIVSVASTYNLVVRARPRANTGELREAGILNQRAHLWLPFAGAWSLEFVLTGTLPTPAVLSAIALDGAEASVYLGTLGPPSESRTRSVVGPGNNRLTDELGVRSLRALLTAGVAPTIRVGTTINPQFLIPAAPAVFELHSDLLAMQSILYVGAAGYTVANLFTLD